MKHLFSKLWSKVRPASTDQTAHASTDQTAHASTNQTALASTNTQNKTDTVEIPCCSENVHIAYRGMSDDRLYLSNDRKWQEVKFFKPNGLRVFCADCRRRIY